MTSHKQDLVDKIAKLPKWAQGHIQTLNMRLAEVSESRNQAFDAYNGGNKSNVFVEGHGARPQIYLPSDKTVTFQTDDGEAFSVSFERHHKTDAKTGIRIRSCWRQMQIAPEVSNAIVISVKEQ